MKDFEIVIDAPTPAEEATIKTLAQNAAFSGRSVLLNDIWIGGRPKDGRG